MKSYYADDVLKEWVWKVISDFYFKKFQKVQKVLKSFTKFKQDSKISIKFHKIPQIFTKYYDESKKKKISQSFPI